MESAKYVVRRPRKGGHGIARVGVGMRAWMKRSSRPCLEAAAMALMHEVHCTPYALLTKCGTSSSRQMRARSSSLSTPRGAKHEVVESTQSTCHAIHAAAMPYTQLPYTQLPYTQLPYTPYTQLPYTPYTQRWTMHGWAVRKCACTVLHAHMHMHMPHARAHAHAHAHAHAQAHARASTRACLLRSDRGDLLAHARHVRAQLVALQQVLYHERHAARRRDRLEATLLIDPRPDHVLCSRPRLPQRLCGKHRGSELGQRALRRPSSSTRSCSRLPRASASTNAARAADWPRLSNRPLLST